MPATAPASNIESNPPRKIRASPHATENIPAKDLLEPFSSSASAMVDYFFHRPAQRRGMSGLLMLHQPTEGSVESAHAILVSSTRLAIAGGTSSPRCAAFCPSSF